MMEAVNLAASVVTVAGLICIMLKTVVRTANWFFFEAKAEFRALQSDVHRFRQSLADVQKQSSWSSPLRVRDVESELRWLEQQLKCVEQGKLICYHVAIRVPSQLSPFLSNWKICGLQRHLQVLRDDLHKIVSSHTLAQSTESRNILEIAVQTYQEAGDTLAPVLQRATTRLPIARSYQGCILEAADANFLTGTGYAESRYGCTATKHMLTDHSTSSFPPVSMLEVSKRFFPESYTSQSQVPDLVIAALHEESFNGIQSLNSYRVLFLQNSRAWTHLNISLDIPMSSKYWRFTRISAHVHPHLNPNTAFTIPMVLLTKLALGLRELGRVQEDTRVHFAVSIKDDNELAVVKVMSPAKRAAPTNRSRRTEQAILDGIYHMGCPRIDERQVARLACVELPNRFLSSLNGNIVQEIMSPDRPPSMNFCYNIQLLHQLRNEEGFARLKGAVVDVPANMLKSYLVDWPETACELLLHRASHPSVTYPWSQIEDWSRQLLQRLRAVHGMGGVVGSLRFQRPPIFVDAHNRLYLWHFDTRVTVSATASPFYPPEFRYLARNWRDKATQSEESLVTPAYDVYQCGQLLWMLAAGWASKGKNALMFKEEFYRSPGSHKRFWFGPDPLPRLPSQVPRWFQEVVDACCAELHARPSCEDILTRFPTPPTDTQIGRHLDNDPPLQSEISMRSCRLQASCCDYCRQQLVAASYHCTICNGGDVDVCQTCFQKGKHCENNEHLLIEIPAHNGLAPVTRYHSSTDAAGKRKMYAL